MFSIAIMLVSPRKPIFIHLPCLLHTLPPDQYLHGAAIGLASALGNSWIDNVCVPVSSITRAKIEPLDCFVADSKAAPWMSRPRSSICWTFPWPMAGVLATWFY